MRSSAAIKPKPKTMKDIEHIVWLSYRRAEINAGLLNALHTIKPYFYPHITIVSEWPEDPAAYARWEGHKLEAQYSERGNKEGIVQVEKLLAPCGFNEESREIDDEGLKILLSGAAISSKALARRLAAEIRTEVMAPDFPNNLGSKAQRAQADDLTPNG